MKRYLNIIHIKVVQIKIKFKYIWVLKKWMFIKIYIYIYPDGFVLIWLLVWQEYINMDLRNINRIYDCLKSIFFILHIKISRIIDFKKYKHHSYKSCIH